MPIGTDNIRHQIGLKCLVGSLCVFASEHWTSASSINIESASLKRCCCASTSCSRGYKEPQHVKIFFSSSWCRTAMKERQVTIDQYH